MQPCGHSLVELLIVMLLSSGVLLGVMSVYEASHRAYNEQEALARIQETGHLVTALLSTEIRSAGYIGCGRLSAHFPIMHHGVPMKMVPEGVLRGDEKAFDLASRPSNRALGEEGIRVLKMATRNADVVGLEPDQRRFQVSEEALFKSGDSVMVSHCHQAAVFKIQRVLPQGWLEASLSLPGFGTGSMIGPLESLFFYIGDTQRKTSRGNPVYGLYVQDLAGKREEIAEGVSHWDIEYSVCRGPPHYGIKRQKAREVTDWTQVVGVHLVLTLDSVMERGGSASDTRLYKRWPLDIALRERQCG